MAVAVTVNVLGALANTYQCERHRRSAVRAEEKGALWIANAERLDALSATVRRLLEEEVPSVVILATLDAEHERLS